jgi:urea transport system permease protein
MLGGLFIGTTLLMPRGIIGTYNSWRGNRGEALKEAAQSASKEAGTGTAASPHAAE